MSELRDTIGTDLRGESFRGRDMRSASLRSADLRGADFAGAQLRGADLRGARTGLQRRWAVIVGLGALLVCVGAGAAAGWAGSVLQRSFTAPAPGGRALGLFVASVLVVFLVATVVIGLDAAARHVLPVAVLVALTAAIIAMVSNADGELGAVLAGTFVLVACTIVALAAIGRTVGGAGNVFLFAVVAATGALVGGQLEGGLAAAAIALVTMLLGRPALEEHAADDLLSRTGAALACAIGTSFRKADLSGATFVDARLRGTDFRGANLEGARFDNADIRLCRFDGQPPATIPPPPRGQIRLTRGGAGPSQ